MKNTFTVNDEGQIFMTTEDGKVWGIPNDPANSDYQAYLASLNDTPQG
jgi:hypothetical protein